MIKQALRLAAVLGIVCMISSSLLALVFVLTQQQIAFNAAAALEAAKKEVLPAGGEGEVMIVTPRGYSGEIKLMVGVVAKRVSGVKVLEQRETPGLGANIIKAEFLGQFQGKGVGDQLEPKKDIDAITGATISSRAVCNGVKEALRKTEKKI